MVPSFLFPRQSADRITGTPFFHRWISILSMLALTAGLLGMLPSTAAAQAGLVVRSIADAGLGSLRQTIIDAPAGATITFSLPTPATIVLASQIPVNKNLTITGPGQNELFLSGGGTNRIFAVSAGTLRLSGMTLRDGVIRGQDANNMNPGTYSGLGGAIFIDTGAGVTASYVTFTNNAAYGGAGGNAVFNAGFYGGGGGGLGGEPTQGGGFGGGGGGGYSTYAAGAGGFGGGGGGNTGSGDPIGSAGYGGSGGSGSNGEAGYGGGGGGGGLGGAVFINTGGALGVQNVTFTYNTAVGGRGGNNLSGFGGGGGGGGAGLGSAVFNAGDICARPGTTYTANTTVAGAAGASACGFGGGCSSLATPGSALDFYPGVFDYSSGRSCVVWGNPPNSLSFLPVVLEENRPAGTLAGGFGATDPDGGETFTFSLVSGVGSEHNASFAISGSQLLTAAVLDFETRAVYNIRARVTDRAGLYLEQAFNLTILDANDAPTAVNLTSTTIAENLVAGSDIGRISAVDQDHSVHTFTLVNPGGACSGADNSAFQITGDMLQSSQVFNYETGSAYTICVRASDAGTPPASMDQQFTISIQNANEYPTSITLSASTVQENLPAGALVGAISTVDPDTGQTHTYETGASPHCPSIDWGFFEVSGNQLLTTRPMDYEARSWRGVCVRSTDNGTPALRFDQPFTITIIDANDAPNDIGLSGSSVAENLPAGQLIGQLSTTDQDLGQTHTYSFTDTEPGCSAADNSLFALDGVELRSAVAFDYETRSSYSVCIQSSDDGTPVEHTARPFILQVTDVNDLPTGIMLTPTSLPENQPVGTSIGTLSATDQDNPPHTFSLVSGDAACDGTDNGAFAISGDQLLNATVYNYEDEASYNICVRAADSASPAGTFDQPFTITVENANEAPLVDTILPDQIIQAGTAYNYAFPAGAFTDPDGDDLVFTAALSDSSPLPAWLSFDPAARTFSGTPIVVQSLELRVTATDPGTLAASHTFRLDVVEDPSNHPPVVLAGIPNALAHVGEPFTHTFAADAFADYDGDPLIYQAVLDGGGALPAWLNFDPLARAFSGTPAAGDIATLTLRVTALDGRGGQVSSLFQIGVDSFVLPWLAQPIPDQVIRLGRPWSFQIPAATFGHAGVGPLLYMAALADGSPLPTWLNFNPDTRTFSGTPPSGAGQMTWQLRVEVFDGPPGMGAVDAFSISPWLASGASLPPGSLLTLVDEIGAGPAVAVKGATRLNRTTRAQATYAGLPLIDWDSTGTQVCYAVGTSDSLRARGDLGRLAIGAADTAGWTLLGTHPAGGGRVCATAPTAVWFDVFLLPAPVAAGGAGSATALPATGFAPDRVTALAPQPEHLAYADLGDVWLEIPALNLKTAITGVPLENDAWDVSWLGSSAGWLEGSAFPGLDGNTVLTGHVYDAQGQPGPFNGLRALAWGQHVIVHAFNVAYTYEVRSVESFLSPRDTKVLQHEDRPWLTLITCQGYDEASGSYRWRSAVRAVLVRTSATP